MAVLGYYLIISSSTDSLPTRVFFTENYFLNSPDVEYYKETATPSAAVTDALRLLFSVIFTSEKTHY